VFIECYAKEIDRSIQLKFEVVEKKDFLISTSNTIACLDYKKLKFPLLLRKWKQGDSFQPLGMQGKKKLSDFFVDKKLSIIDKQNAWVLCSADDIVWVVGQRIAEGYKVNESTSQVYKAELNS
jgi:tRNA(Ile)-lysidine synthase